MDRTPPSTFDPHAWDLLVGVALLVGCNAAPQGQDTAGTTTTNGGTNTNTNTNSGTETDSTNTGTDEGPECVSNSDCNFGYTCEGGFCEYAGYQDGTIWYDCYSLDDCQDFYLCNISDGYFGGWCEPVGEPPPACDPDALDIPTTLDAGATPLALSFVDVDADGQAELVVATAGELLLFELDADVPVVTPRDPPSSQVTSMVAGQFDPDPGQDLVLLTGDSYHSYPSNGVDGFLSPSVEATPDMHTTGLLAGDFDGQDPSDRVAWGPNGALLDRGGGDIVLLDQLPVSNAAAFDLGAPYGGLVTTSGADWTLYDLTGALLGQAQGMDHGLTAVTMPGFGRYLVATNYGGWSWLDARDATTLELNETLSHPDPISQLGAGDLDGGGRDDLVVFGGGRVTLWFNALGGGCLREATHGVDGEALVFAFGDHDGDGDDELALGFDGFEVVIIDGE